MRAGPGRGGELTKGIFALVEVGQCAWWTQTGLEAFRRILEEAKQDGLFDRVVSCAWGKQFMTARGLIRLLVNANKGI